MERELIHPAKDKLQGVEEAPEPKNVKELRSYLGIINYYHKFLPKASILLKPLYELLKQDVKWSWGKTQKDAFKMSKELLKSSTLLVHYDLRRELVLETDASPFGVGVVLSQVMDDNSTRPLAYASRTLAPAEQKYSQIERKGLAIIFGLKRFHKYLSGRRFSIFTDHRPLLGLFKEHRPTSLMASARIQRWALLLGSYDYNLQYKPGKDLGNADALSRLPSQVQPSDQDLPKPQEVVLSMDYVDNMNTPLTCKQIALETSHDPLLSCVRNKVLLGWPPKCDDGNLKPFYTRRDELSVQADCILWGSRVVIPLKFRDEILTELHETHPGIVRMKSLSRSYVWWPNLDKDIEALVRQCKTCQEVSNRPPVSPLHPWEFPHNVWERIHLDYAGPFEGRMILVIVDAFSKFIDAHVMTTSTSKATI